MANNLTLAFVCSICLCLASESYAQSPEICTKPLQVMQATHEAWVPGIVQNNSVQAGGTIYRISLKIKKRGGVTFQKLILADRVLDVEANHNGQRGAIGPFGKRAQVEIIARTEKQAPTIAPDEYMIRALTSENAQALILFTFRGRSFVRPVKIFEERNPTLNR